MGAKNAYIVNVENCARNLCVLHKNQKMPNLLFKMTIQIRKVNTNYPKTQKIAENTGLTAALWRIKVNINY